ncbi:3-ketoacyl-ACP reductase [Bauldia litoralis]|uniref:3-ketoacyl-ACP reductase n=1 Tax=Bauldia litoralis TaxID=665467 RepID=UPI003267692B
MSERRVALVTGGRRGIGRGIALALASSGFDVMINDIVGGEDADETIRLFAEAGGTGDFVDGDIANVDGHEAMVDRVYQRFGRLDCLANNAGAMCVRGDMLEATPEDFDRVLGINLRGTFFLTQAAARRMIAEEDRREGRCIVTITSANSVMVSPEKTPYCISKSALSMVVQLFGIRLAEHGIASFEIRPGFIRTDMSAPVRERFTTMIEAGATPIRRWGEAEDVGRTVASLATGALPYSVGQPINVDGGLLVSRL